MPTDQTQLFGALDPATLAGLRDSIGRLGVLVPVAKDQHGNMLDGHHRKVVADELGVKYRVDVIQVTDEQQADEIRHTLNVDRRQLSGDDLKRYIVTLADLREPSGVGALSQREIAERSGVNVSTVSRMLADPTVASQQLPERRRGNDGKVRPAARPAVVATKNVKDAERAQSALSALPQQSGVLDLRTAERKQQRAARAEHDPVVSVETVGIDLRHGDFREVLDDLDGTVDAIVTDPPYPAEFLPLFGRRPIGNDPEFGYTYDQFEDYGLSEIADRILKPGGVCAVMVGQSYLPEIMERLGERLTYHWTLAYLTPGGQSAQLWQRKVNTFWKPVLLYTNGEYDGEWLGDVTRSNVNDNDKEHHYWGQSESGMADLLRRLTKPGQLVCDPFLGGGTTAVVCRDLGRRFVGCDIDEAAVKSANARFAEAS